MTVAQVENSEWGVLTVARQKIFPTERRDTILATYIQQAKNELLRRTGRTWATIIADSEMKIAATDTILMMVGLKLLRRTNAARSDITEVGYGNQIVELNEAIDIKIMNLEVQDSPISVSNVEPDMVDPDSDYSYD